MVFQSLPLYQDPPNWPQQVDQQHGGAAADQNSQLPPRPPPCGPATIKAGSMVERARLAKIPQPESALKCPRCDSTNTKFCYFNNYSLSQPRHFCKTCRRYWTSGGALRNVPVGGGCRRNKRTKSNHRSKSPLLLKTGSGSINVHSNELTSDSCTTGDVIHLPPSTQLPILPPLHHLGDFNSADIGLNFAGMQAPAVADCGGVEFPTSSSGGGLLEQWKLQQFPFISNLDAPAGLYPFEGVENSIGQLRWVKPANSDGSNQVKMEGNNGIQGLNLSRNLLGNLSGSNDQYWSSSNINAWTDLPGFTSSSSSHLM